MGKRKKSTDKKAGFGDMAAVWALLEAAPGKVEITVALPSVDIEYLQKLYQLAIATEAAVGSRRERFSWREVPLEKGRALEVFAKLKNIEFTVTAAVTDAQINEWRAAHHA